MHRKRGRNKLFGYPYCTVFDGDRVLGYYHLGAGYQSFRLQTRYVNTRLQMERREKPNKRSESFLVLFF